MMLAPLCSQKKNAGICTAGSGINHPASVMTGKANRISVLR
jgi:hypothetical protein